MKPLLLAIFPQLSGHGGVQRLGRHMVTALAASAARRGARLEVLSLLDRDGSFTSGAREYTYRGFGGRRVALALAVFRLRGAARALWIGHPFLAPLGMLAGGGVPHHVHAHGIEVWKPLAPLRRLALRRAAIVSTSSDYTAREAVRLQGIAPGVTRTLHPSLPPEFEPAPATGARRNAMLSVARMEPGDRAKGVDLCMRAFGMVAAQCPGWTLELVGDGADRPRLEALARECAPAGRVIFHGRIDDASLDALYGQCRIFCLPSTKEGFGMVYIEAMAHGLPALGVDSTAVPEAVAHGESGLLSPPGDATVLSGNMASLMRDSQRLERYSLAARRWARGFSFPAFEERVDGILQELWEAGR